MHRLLLSGSARHGDPHLECIVEKEDAGNAHSEQQLHRHNAEHLRTRHTGAEAATHTL